MSEYQPANPTLWSGRTDTEETLPALRWHQQMQCLDLRHPLPDLQGQLTLLGFACDAGVTRNKGRAGAAEGPDALRGALANASCEAVALYDAGNLACTGDELETAQAALGQAVAQLRAAGARPVVLGGGHEVAWASFQGLMPALTGQRLGIINFDAHLDLRNPNPAGSSGTPFRQIGDWCAAHGQSFHYLVLGVNPSANTSALFDYARAHGVHWIEDTELEAGPLAEALAQIEHFLQAVDALYLTVCLDVFNAASAPGVSAPAALGLSPARTLRVFRELLAMARRLGKPVWLLDVAELNPRFDRDGQTARLAARLIWEYQRACG